MMFGYGPPDAFGGIFMVLWWAFLIAVLIALWRWLTAPKDGGDVSQKALDILKERYARGEIDQAQFERMKRDLTK